MRGRHPNTAKCTERCWDGAQDGLLRAANDHLYFLLDLVLYCFAGATQHYLDPHYFSIYIERAQVINELKSAMRHFKQYPSNQSFNVLGFHI